MPTLVMWEAAMMQAAAIQAVATPKVMTVAIERRRGVLTALVMLQH